MAAISLAIIGKDREPLYLREFSSDDCISEEEFFGLTTPCTDGKGAVSNTTRIGGFECSIRQQFILHAALDRYEQLAGPSTGLGFRSSGASGSDAMFVGLLCPVEEMRVYGYMTTTKILFILVVEDDAVPEHQQAVDADIKALMVKVHRLFVEYSMNPFKEIGAPIVSRRFEDGVSKLVSSFNQSDGMI